MKIGIDLGTTNSTLSYGEDSNISLFDIEQFIDHQLLGKETSLPSFVFLSPEGEEIVGVYAKERGSEVPDRVVHSAKSWLCHAQMDRRAPFLPQGECEKKLSPVDACCMYLRHLKQTWEAEHGSLQQHTVIVTVPASFDPSARQLVEEACDAAGLPPRLLIEEPLAAFYAWLFEHQQSWRNILKVGDTVLVVDIGGGTTDFSLIKVEEQEGAIALERMAVGEHLLLGGDNMDLALAYYIQQHHQLALDDWQIRVLIHACRDAKEKLLAKHAPQSMEIIIPGRGSSLIGGMTSVTLTQQEVVHLLVEGFFPKVSFDEGTHKSQRIGLTEDNLTYVKDPRITAHLAQFLIQPPSAILFNGGVMHCEAFRKRLIEQVQLWKGSDVLELPDADYNFAVSRGAVYYGQVREGEGIRVRAPIAKSYFIGVERPAPAVPGLLPIVQGVCIVPKGMEEGDEVFLAQTFSLCVGEPVQFRFFASMQTASVGSISSVETLTELHPIETTLEGEDVSLVRVQLKAKITELGVLELWCSSPNKAWKLEFNVRAQASLSLASS